MLHQAWFVCLIGLGLGLLSCQHSRDQQAHMDGAGLESSKPMLPQGIESEDPQRWSPARRRAGAGYHYLISQNHLFKGEGDRALQFMRSAYSLDPNPYVGRSLVELLIRLGKIDEGLQFSHRLVLQYPRDPLLNYHYARVLAGKRQLDAALLSVAKSLKLNPQHRESWILKIQILQDLGKDREALKTAEEYAQFREDDLDSLTLLTRLYILAGSQKEALASAKKVVRVAGESPESVLLYAHALEMNGRTAAAAKQYEKLFHKITLNDHLVAKMVNLYRQLGGLEEVLEILNDMAARYRGKSAGVHIQRAILMSELGRHQEAADLLGKQLQMHPDSDLLRFMSGLSLEKIGRDQEALQVFEQIDANSRLGYDSELRRTIVLHRLGRIEAALKMAESALSHRNAAAEAWELMASLHAHQKDFQNALHFSEEGFRRHPQTWRLLFLQGVYLEKLGRMEDCIEVMKSVIRNDPSYSSAYNYLGYLYAEQGVQLDEAEKLLKKALELKPNDGYYLDSLGWIYKKKGQLQEAKKYLQRAAAVLPSEGVVHDHLGDVLFELGEVAEAVRAWETALEGDLEEIEIAKIKTKLQSARAQIDNN